MNKKICALLLTAAMCFCFTACSGNTQQEEQSTASTVTTSTTQTSTSTTVSEATTGKEKTTKPSTTKKESTTVVTTAKAKKKSNSKVTKPTTAKVKTTKKKNDAVTCSVTVECKSILNHMNDLKDGHEEFVPDDGYIIKNYSYSGKQGDTAYDALKTACSDNGIKLTSQKTTYGIYISGINNLDEFDCGKQSGWMYKVNDMYPNTTCGNVTVSTGDSIVFEYVCSYQ